MVRLVLRRARVQQRLLTAVVLLVATASSLVGVCVLLLGTTQERAFHVEVERAPRQDVDVTAFLGEVPGAGLADVREHARDVVVGVLRGMRPTVTTTASARMRHLPGGDRLGYLATIDSLDRRAALVSGHWPTARDAGPVPAVVPDTTARLLHLRVGDRVRLGSEIGADGVRAPVPVVVVGTFRPLAGTGWDGDPLAGAGVDASYSDGSVTAPAYGPFVVDDAAFLASGSSVSRLRVTAHPTLDRAGEGSLRSAVGSLSHASELLSSRIGDQARISRVASDLGTTLDRVDAQQASTRATVLVVLLLGTALSLAAVLLAGWLVGAVREEERRLLLALGLSRGQQVGTALAEAALLAAVAALLAVPAAAVIHSRLTHLPDLAAAGLAQSPSVPWQLVLAVLLGAVLLSLALVAASPDAAVPTGPSSRRGSVVRFALDGLLLVVAAAGWWQLRTQPTTAGTGVDVLLTAAPVLCVAALTLVAVRLVPLLLEGLAQAATRSRALVLPLATRQAVRRPHRGTAMVLVAAAVATAVLGVALRATWERSQRDQAALRVGTDVALALPAGAGPEDAAAVVAAATTSSRSVVSAVVRRPVALGRYVGDEGAPPMIVAVDTRDAGALLRGRLDPGSSWADVGRRLTPDAPVAGVALPDEGTGIELDGTAPGLQLTVRPTAVVQDATGFRTAVVAAPLPLDGRPHPVDWLAPVGAGRQLVGVRLELDGDPTGSGQPTGPTAAVSVRLRIPGEAAARRTWEVPPTRNSAVQGASVAVAPAAAGSELVLQAGVDLAALPYSDATVLATAFPAPAAVPVAASQDLVDAVGTKVGGELSAIVGDVDVPLRVAAVVPTVPSAPGQVAVLADGDSLSRSLIVAGHLDPVVDAWWVGRPAPTTVRALEDLRIGEVTTRPGVAAGLAHGPLRVTTPSALLTLAAAAAALLLVGVALLLGAERHRRSAEVVRLRALGATPRTARRVLLLEQTVFLVPLVVAGALVGVAAAVTLGPELVRSDLGAAPVPDAVLAWPWTTEVLLVGGLLLGALGVSAVATAVHVGRSDPARLRAEDG